ncbi:MAG: hypothetical protein PHS14_01670 [Elusimicrobia bacterium]|nr:hypothetical protein [Elusimicrobiota bacterium]
MIKRHRAGLATGCLMLLWTAVAAQQTQTPQTPAAPGQPAPIPAPPPALPIVPAAPALPVAPVLPVVPVQPLPVPPAAVSTTTVPGLAPILKPIAPPPPPLGSELRGKLKEDERHFGEKSAAAKREFDLREAEEKKGFEATLADKGFWERRSLTRAFRADQAKRHREFNDEQETKRRTYEWRYP